MLGNNGLIRDPFSNEPIQSFFDKYDTIKKSDFIIFGAPLDLTTSYRKGARFAPNAIRQASLHIDTYSRRTGLAWSNLKLKDFGNISMMDDLLNSLNNVEKGIKKIYNLGKKPVMIGGEHTVTYAAINAIKPDLMIVFDAHMDLRDELFGEKLCHATYLRRILERHDFEIIIIGARAFSKEELIYANSEERINIVKTHEISKIKSVDLIKSVVDSVDSVYLSFDMDVIDPSEASAVGNPAPEGASISMVLDLINKVSSKKFKGFDLNEVTPLYDNGLTSIQAAHILLETLYSILND
jgi:agmatinase